MTKPFQQLVLRPHCLQEMKARINDKSKEMHVLLIIFFVLPWPSVEQLFRSWSQQRFLTLRNNATSLFFLRAPLISPSFSSLFPSHAPYEWLRFGSRGPQHYEAPSQSSGRVVGSKVTLHLWGWDDGRAAVFAHVSQVSQKTTRPSGVFLKLKFKRNVNKSGSPATENKQAVHYSVLEWLAGTWATRSSCC